MFGSDICTCRPYLIYGIEEAVKEAQKGGSGVGMFPEPSLAIEVSESNLNLKVIYFRKEGRALGEVTKVFEYFSGSWVFCTAFILLPWSTSILINLHNTHFTTAHPPTSQSFSNTTPQIFHDSSRL